MQGDLKSAVSYYKSSLDIDPDFEPATTRLQVIQCLLLFDDKKTAMSEILWNVSWFLFSQISNAMRFRRIVKCAFFYIGIIEEWESISITLLEAMKKQLRIIIIIICREMCMCARVRARARTYVCTFSFSIAKKKIIENEWNDDITNIYCYRVIIISICIGLDVFLYRTFKF